MAVDDAVVVVVVGLVECGGVPSTAAPVFDAAVFEVSVPVPLDLEDVVVALVVAGPVEELVGPFVML